MDLVECLSGSLGRRQPAHFLHHRTDVGDRSIEAHGPDDVAGRFGQEAVLLRRPDELLFGAPQIGDVVQRAFEDDRSVCPAPTADDAIGPDRVPISMPPPKLHPQIRARRHRQHPLKCLGIPRVDRTCEQVHLVEEGIDGIAQLLFDGLATELDGDIGSDADDEENISTLLGQIAEPVIAAHGKRFLLHGLLNDIGPPAEFGLLSTCIANTCINHPCLSKVLPPPAHTASVPPPARPHGVLPLPLLLSVKSELSASANSPDWMLDPQVARIVALVCDGPYRLFRPRKGQRRPAPVDPLLLLERPDDDSCTFT